jgi:alpha-mannosidase
MSDEAANSFLGYPHETAKNVRVVEDGEVRTKVEAYFSYGSTTATVIYTIPKNDSYVDIDIKLNSATPNRMIKYSFNTNLSGTPFGETAFGSEELFRDERESVFHKWCGIKNVTKDLYILNRGTYGGSFTDNTVKLSLLRTPIYAAHPIHDRQIAPHDRYSEHIDIGQREFSFRLTTESDVTRKAQAYNEAQILLSFFPSGDGKRPDSPIEINCENIILSTVRKTDSGYSLRLFNSSDRSTSATLNALGKKIALDFGKFEIKTVEI